MGWATLSRPPDLFVRALAITLPFEGGYYPGHLAGDPNPTMKGITQNTYTAWRKSRGLPAQPVRQIGDEEVHVIYKTRFWDRASCGNMAWPLCALVFDWAVNSGPKHAITGLARAGADPAAYLTHRWAFLENLMARRPATQVFRRGWARRVNHLCTVAGVPPCAM